MSRAAINVNPNGSDTAAAVAAEGFSWVRFPMKPWFDTAARVRSYVGRGLKVILCSDSDTEAGFSSHTASARYYREQVRGYERHVVIQAGNNEFEGEGGSSSSGSAEDLFQELVAWRQVFGHDCGLIGPGMVQGHPERWPAVCTPLVDAIAVHPYVGQYWQLRDAIRRYEALGKPVWVTEFPYYTHAYPDEVLRHSDGPAAIYNRSSWKDANGNQWLDGHYDLYGNPTWRVSAARLVNWDQHKETPQMDDATAKQHAFQDLYQAGSMTTVIPFNTGAALVKHWMASPSRFGSAAGPERYAKHNDGTLLAVYQAFARGVLRWDAKTGAIQEML
jgi:hypothetical protein